MHCFLTSGTNINKALLDGLELIKDFLKSDEERSPIFVFLTDGSPTKGEQNVNAILRNFRMANESTF